MRTVTHSTVRPVSRYEYDWLTGGLPAGVYFLPAATPNTGPFQLDTLEDFDHGISKDEALLADNLVPLEPRGHCAELAPPRGTLAMFVLVIGSTVLWVAMRELFWR